MQHSRVLIILLFFAYAITDFVIKTRSTKRNLYIFKNKSKE